MSAPTPLLTQAELSKAQAEAEGYQNGPEPPLNPANLYTQEEMGNPIVFSTVNTVPYYPLTKETPNLQLSLDDMSVTIANNFVVLDNAIPIVGRVDLMGQTAGAVYAYPTLGSIGASGVYNLVMVATAIPPQGVFPQAQLFVDVTYTDNAGNELNPGTLQLSDNLQAASINEAIYATTGAPIVVYSSYVTFGMAGALPANAWWVPVNLGGSGTAAYGATLHQATSGATAFYYGTVSLGGVPGNMVYTVLTGVDGSNSGYVWTDPISGQTFTPSGSTTAATFTGPGFGVSMVQFVTGSFGPEMVIPTTVLYLGPYISGVADKPSGVIHVAGTPPSTTHNYAWYDPVNGGVFVPSAPWTDAATRVVFPYNLHIRISELL
jgi:hypothetical protein